MWRYIHARTLGRVTARVRGPAPDRSADVRRLLQRTIESRAAFSILQVGAYDGLSNDAVHDLIKPYEHVRAVLLEPQPGPFSALQRRWQGVSRVTPIRAALSDRTGERQLFVIADKHKHRHPFPDQVSSFYRSRVEAACSRYVWRPSADFIATVSVPTVDWKTLERDFGRFDFVSIDAEGYDAEVLSQIDCERSPPEIILYEHVLMSKRVRAECERRLAAHGYTIATVSQNDTLATRGAAAL